MAAALKGKRGLKMAAPISNPRDGHFEEVSKKKPCTLCDSYTARLAHVIESMVSGALMGAPARARVSIVT